MEEQWKAIIPLNTDNVCRESISQLSAKLTTTLALHHKTRTTTEILSFVKGLLTSPDQKWAGIALLPAVIDTCRAEDFSVHAGGWLKQLMSTLAHESAEGSLAVLAAECIGMVLRHAGAFEELSREVSTNAISTLLTLLTRTALASSTIYRLRLIETCLSRFPSSCGTYKKQISTRVLTYLDGLYKPVDGRRVDREREDACRCLAALPLCGAAGKDAAKRSGNWTEHVIAVIGTLDRYLRLVLVGTEQVEEVRGDQPSSLFFHESEDDTSDMYENRIICLLMVLRCMLSKSLSFEVKVPVGALIKLMSSFVNLSTRRDVPLLIFNRFLSEGFPPIASAVLDLLSAVLTQLGSSLLPRARILAAIISRLLHFSREWNDAALRSRVYQVLCCWLSCMNDLPESLHEELITSIIADICPSQMDAPRSMSSGEPRRSGAQDQQKNLQMEISDTRMASRKRDTSRNKLLSRDALTCIQKLLSSVGATLGADLLQRVLDCAVTTVTSICQSIVAPYGDTECRVKMLQVVATLCRLQHHKLVMPVSLFVSLYRKVLRCDDDPVVKAACQAWLKEVAAILHPLHQPYLKTLPVSTKDTSISSIQNHTSTEPMPFDSRSSAFTIAKATRQAVNVIDESPDASMVAEPPQVSRVVLPELLSAPSAGVLMSAEDVARSVSSVQLAQQSSQQHRLSSTFRERPTTHSKPFQPLPTQNQNLPTLSKQLQLPRQSMISQPPLLPRANRMSSPTPLQQQSPRQQSPRQRSPQMQRSPRQQSPQPNKQLVRDRSPQHSSLTQSQWRSNHQHTPAPNSDAVGNTSSIHSFSRGSAEVATVQPMRRGSVDVSMETFAAQPIKRGDTEVAMGTAVVQPFRRSGDSGAVKDTAKGIETAVIIDSSDEEEAPAKLLHRPSRKRHASDERSAHKEVGRWVEEGDELVKMKPLDMDEDVLNILNTFVDVDAE